MTVRLPAGKKLSDGPFPTFVEYSGYQTAAPNDLFASVVDQLTAGAPADPLAPASSTAVGSLIGPLLGFAVVSVQMRGSGCSGGAFDLFDLPTTYDGYDAVETVAAQKLGQGRQGRHGRHLLLRHHPALRGRHAAPAPRRDLADVGQRRPLHGHRLPGRHLQLRLREDLGEGAHGRREAGARRRPAVGPVLAKQGDKHCIANQKLRLQTQDALAIQKQNPFRTPSLFSQRAPGPWLKRAKVPVFLIGQFQDEQTGGHFAESLKYLDKNPNVWVTLQNGVHADSLGPSTITRWAEFLKLYVADEIPVIPQTVHRPERRALPVPRRCRRGPGASSRGSPARPTSPPPGHLQEGSSRTGADGQRRRPAGAGLDRRSLGARLQRVAAEARRGPRATTWAPSGTLGAKPANAGSASYTADPSARPKQTLPGDGAEDAWKAQPPYHWAPIAAGKGLGFVSQAVTNDVVIAGPSSLDLYLKSSARDTDLQVTLSEVRADGNETYVQNGWLRASHRKLSARQSTVARPVPHAPEEGRRKASQAASTCSCGSRSIPWRTRSARGRGSASRSRPWAAIGRAGPSPRWTRAIRTTRSRSAARAPRASCSPSWREPTPRARRSQRPRRCAASPTGPTSRLQRGLISVRGDRPVGCSTCSRSLS